LVLSVSDKVTQWIGHSFQRILGYSILGLGMMFALIGLAIYLGDLIDNEALGYVIVAAPLLLLGMIFAFSKPMGLAKSIQRQFMSEILKSLEEDQSSNLQLPESKGQERLKEHE
jgi:flagellar motor component MotA